MSDTNTLKLDTQFDLSKFSKYSQIRVPLIGVVAEEMLLPLPEELPADETYVETPYTLSCENFVLNSRVNKRATLLVGAPGIGKTCFVKHYIHKYNAECYYANKNFLELGYFPGVQKLELGPIAASFLRNSQSNGEPRQVVLFIDDVHFYPRSFFYDFKSAVDPEVRRFTFGNLSIDLVDQVQIIMTANNTHTMDEAFLNCVDILHFQDNTTDEIFSFIEKKHKERIGILAELQILFTKIWNELISRPAKAREVVNLFNRTLNKRFSGNKELKENFEEELRTYATVLKQKEENGNDNQ